MVLGWLKRRRRARLLLEHVPEEWAPYLAALPFAAGLRAGEADRLVAYARALEAETFWEGCGGLEVTEEMVRSISLQACRLILNLDQDHYRKVRTVLVYPSAFVFTPEEGEAIHAAGLAVPDGPVILSWEHVRAGARNGRDGRNVVYHEFAHKLDMLDGYTDGTPALESTTQFHAWERTLAVELSRLRRATDRGGETLIDPYGSQDVGELFAESTEVFFERPRELKKRRPKLYRALKRFYRQDPARRG